MVGPPTKARYRRIGIRAYRQREAARSKANRGQKEAKQEALNKEQVSDRSHGEQQTQVMGSIIPTLLGTALALGLLLIAAWNV
jgi:hypothetical protein